MGKVSGSDLRDGGFEKAFWSIIRGKYSVVGRNEYKAQEAKVLVRFFQLANNLTLRRKTEDK